MRSTIGTKQTVPASAESAAWYPPYALSVLGIASSRQVQVENCTWMPVVWLACSALARWLRGTASSGPVSGPTKPYA
eukprot:3935995-Rhodomonas_salina.1